MTKIHKINTLELAQPKRLATVMGTWKSLSDGDAIQITVGHDPSHLKKLFQAQFGNTFHWKFQQQGPKIWIVKITKIILNAQIL